MQVAHALAQRKEENDRRAIQGMLSIIILRFDARRKRRGSGRREEEQRKEEYLCFKMVAVKNNVVSTGTERQADQLQRRV